MLIIFPFPFHVTRSGHSIQQDGIQERWDRDLVGPEETRRAEVDLRNALRGWVFAESRRGDLLGMGKIGTSIKG